MTPRYGCYDAVRVAGYRVQVGWTEDGRRIMTWHPDTMSPECRYDMRSTDPRCEGCSVP
jgi:hypothetical protein